MRAVHSCIGHTREGPMHPPGSHIPTNIPPFYMMLCDRKREIFAFRPSLLTYQLSVYQHKQIHATPTLVLERGRCRRHM